ncbi:MAG: head GIN domain-containing protein [Spirochaetales bacterium]
MKCTTRVLVLGIVLVASATSAFAGGVVESVSTRGSGELVSREFDFDDFTDVEVGYNFEVTVRQSDSYRVAVTTDDNIMELLRIEQRGREVEFELQRGVNINPTTVEIEILMPELRSISLSGSSEGSVTMELDGGSFDADLSGSSELRGRLAAERVFLSLSGSSTVDLQGGADELEVDASGSSEVELYDFPVTRADASLSGASDLFVTVSEELSVDASGASTVRYRGNPGRVEADTSGGSSVREE